MQHIKSLTIRYYEITHINFLHLYPTESNLAERRS